MKEGENVNTGTGNVAALTRLQNGARHAPVAREREILGPQLREGRERAHCGGWSGVVCCVGVYICVCTQSTYA